MPSVGIRLELVLWAGCSHHTVSPCPLSDLGAGMEPWQWSQR